MTHKHASIYHFQCDYMHRMNHMYHMCIHIHVWFHQMCMVNQLKVGLDWHVWLDWLWSTFWVKFLMKTNEKKKKRKRKKEHVFFPKCVQTFECLHENEYYVLWLHVPFWVEKNNLRWSPNETPTGLRRIDK